MDSDLPTSPWFALQKLPSTLEDGLVGDLNHLDAETNYLTSLSKLLKLDINGNALFVPTRLQFAKLSTELGVQIMPLNSLTSKDLSTAMLTCSLFFAEAVSLCILKTVDIIFNLDMPTRDLDPITKRIHDVLARTFELLNEAWTDQGKDHDLMMNDIKELISRNAVAKPVPNGLYLKNVEPKFLSSFIQKQIQETYDQHVAIKLRVSQLIAALCSISRYTLDTEDPPLILTCTSIALFQESLFAMITQMLTTRMAIEREILGVSQFNGEIIEAPKAVLTARRSNASDIWLAEPIGEEEGVPCATKEQILKAITEDSGNLHKIIIATYHTFTSPLEMLQGIFARLVPPKGIDANISVVTVKAGATLKYWLKTSFSDFDEEMITLLTDFCTNSLPKSGKAGTELAKNLLTLVQQKVRSLGVRKPHLPQLQIDIPDFQSCPIQVLLDNPKEIAAQLSLISSQYFQKIGAMELLNTTWSNPQKMWKSPNVIRVIKRTDHIAFWVASVILSQLRSTKKRVKVLSSFINIGLQLMKLQDFNSLMGIVVGLNTSAVARLKATWKEVTPELMEGWNMIQALMSPERAFAAYRAELVSAVPPGVPFLAVYLSDLTFIEEGNDDLINGLINVGKKEMIYKVIEKLELFQVDSYDQVPLEPLHSYLKVLPCVSEDMQYQMSLVAEPKEQALGNPLASSEGAPRDYALSKRGRTGSVKALVQRRASFNTKKKATAAKSPDLWSNL